MKHCVLDIWQCILPVIISIITIMKMNNIFLFEHFMWNFWMMRQNSSLVVCSKQKRKIDQKFLSYLTLKDSQILYKFLENQKIDCSICFLFNFSFQTSYPNLATLTSLKLNLRQRLRQKLEMSGPKFLTHCRTLASFLFSNWMRPLITHKIWRENRSLKMRKEILNL